MTGDSRAAGLLDNASYADALFGDSKRFLAFIGAVLLLSLQFQTLPFNVRVQMLPLTTVLAVVFLPFIARDIPRSPLLTVVSLFIGYSVVHSVIALGVDLFAGAGTMRVYAWLRQIVAVLMGYATYLVLRSTLRHLEDRAVMRWVVIGAFPALLLSFLNILWGTLGQDWAGSIVTNVREVVSPEGYTSPFRATGFATEPASLAASLVTILLPLFLYEFGIRRPSPWMLAALVLALLAFSWTFSATGVLLLLFVLGTGVFLGPNRRLLTSLIVGFILLSAIGILIAPSNQIIRHATVFGSGGTNISFTDRFYSAFGPFINIFDSWSSIGYGLGGVVTHFAELVPEDVRLEILLAKYEGLPSLTSVFGRVLAETGLIGWGLFMAIFVYAYRMLAVLVRTASSRAREVLYASVRLGLIAVFLSIFFAIGPYHTPYLWLWFALIDARYIDANRIRNTENSIRDAGLSVAAADR